MMNRTKVGLLDDELLFREGLRGLLESVDDIEVVITGNNGHDFLKNLSVLEETPDAILLDMEMPEMNGIEFTKKLLAAHPDIKIVVLSSHYTPSFIINMIELGASAYLKKNEEIDEVIKTVLNVCKNGFHYNDHVLKLIRDYMKHAKTSMSKKVSMALTEREKEVLVLICQQHTTKEIANQLYLSPRTVEGHRNNLLEKTESKNIAGLVIYAVENNLFKTDQINPFNSSF